ncbi:MAG: D-alanyl-D-alanine carboxypeptidase [Alphaproteobacteria bacterium]|nr:D-alanyl-D-alanine carboxypeptidase [Alphaproteobacteria bacterium]
MDADTGAILHQRYADKTVHPASLTKIMTLLMVFEALESGKIDLNDRVRISNHAAAMVPSKLGLKPGSSIRVKDAIYALVTKSANDIAVALAEHLAGSERNFARRMNAEAIKIGMTRTTFKNASGLHDPGQITTARDMAKMARYVINEYPSYYRYFARQSFTYAGKTYRNHNHLMETYKGMDGMKTGYVAASGFNLVASAVRNDRRLIGVVFGGRTAKTRNAHMEALLDQGFSKMNKIRIAKADVPLPARKPATLDAAAQKIASSESSLGGGFEKLIGEGDFDPALSSRIETGLMAIAAHKGEQLAVRKAAFQASAPPQNKPVLLAYAPPPSARLSYNKRPWSIQIGAFQSRVATDRAIHKALTRLPSPYSQAQPLIAPMKAGENWLFRARLTGYTKEEALAACNYLSDCLPVAPMQ